MDITATDNVPDINEAKVVANKPSKYHMPKIHRVSQHKRRSDKKSVRFTCDADNMKSGEVDKRLSDVSNSTGHDGRDCKDKMFIEPDGTVHSKSVDDTVQAVENENDIRLDNCL